MGSFGIPRQTSFPVIDCGPPRIILKRTLLVRGRGEGGLYNQNPPIKRDTRSLDYGSFKPQVKPTRTRLFAVLPVILLCDKT